MIICQNIKIAIIFKDLDILDNPIFLIHQNYCKGKPIDHGLTYKSLKFQHVQEFHFSVISSSIAGLSICQDARVN